MTAPSPRSVAGSRTRSRAGAVVIAAMLMAWGTAMPAASADASKGKMLLQQNCGRCHAVTADAASPLAAAPNLFIVLGSYPGERLEFELAEGIGSRHRDMPQVQFSGEDISSIYYYLHGAGAEGEQRRQK